MFHFLAYALYIFLVYLAPPYFSKRYDTFRLPFDCYRIIKIALSVHVHLFSCSSFDAVLIVTYLVSYICLLFNAVYIVIHAVENSKVTSIYQQATFLPSKCENPRDNAKIIMWFLSDAAFAYVVYSGTLRGTSLTTKIYLYGRSY